MIGLGFLHQAVQWLKEKMDYSAETQNFSAISSHYRIFYFPDLFPGHAGLIFFAFVGTLQPNYGRIVNECE